MTRACHPPASEYGVPMSLTLSAADVAALARTAHLLATPLDYASVDGWRSAVNRGLKQVLAAETASFLLPSADGPLLYSEEHDAEGLARCEAEHPPPPLPDGTPIWAHMLGVRVATLSDVYGPDLRYYRQSAYYNEFAVLNGAQHTIAALLPLESGAPHPLSVVSVQLSRPGGRGRGNRDFGARDQMLLQLLLPSLAAGAAAVRQWGLHRAHLLQTVDAIGRAVLVCDLSGRALHQTPALAAMLAGDRESAALLAAAHRTAAALTAGARSHPGAALSSQSMPSCGVRTGAARYRVWATAHGAPRERDPLVLVTLERLTPAPPPPAELRRRFGLTPSEARVALLLARGLSNAALVDALGVSASTARRHTEHVLRKLGVHSRAAVASRVAEPL